MYEMVISDVCAKSVSARLSEPSGAWMDKGASSEVKDVNGGKADLTCRSAFSGFPVTH